MSTKFPTTLMVLCVVSNEGDVMPPHIFPKGLRVDTGEYLNVMETVVKPWMDQIAGNRHYIFQQDGAPCSQQQENAELAQEESPGDVGEGSVASQLAGLQSYGLFCVGRY